MALTKDQRFYGEVLWFLLRNGEDFRILYNGKEYMSIGSSVFEDGVLMKEYEKSSK